MINPLIPFQIVFLVLLSISVSNLQQTMSTEHGEKLTDESFTTNIILFDLVLHNNRKMETILFPLVLYYVGPQRTWVYTKMHAFLIF